MQLAAQMITPCLWFDTEAEDAANFYCSVFKNSKIRTINRYGKEGHERHGKEAGSVMAVEFELAGQTFAALNGGPARRLSGESLKERIMRVNPVQVLCEDPRQETFSAASFGMLVDRFGTPWMINCEKAY